MFGYYKKVIVSLTASALLSLVGGYLAFDLTFTNAALMPSDSSSIGYKWVARTYSDAAEGGFSHIDVIDDGYSYSLSMFLNSEKDHPFAMGEMAFVNEMDQPNNVDLSGFDTLAFMAKCSPASTLTFSLFSVDENASSFDDERSDRISTRYFHCDNTWQNFNIDITRLDTPEWWFKWYNQELSNEDYNLKSVKKIAFGSSIQSPMNVRSTINIRAIELSGKDWKYLYQYIVIFIFGWAMLGIWLFKNHTKFLMERIQEKIQKDRPLIAYKQLTIESHKDKDKTAILKLMATEYANPEMSLEYVVQTLGINRNKVNEILKSELGYTFTSYLNKLRLSEAARLLAENPDANVSEIAYSVGYKNVSYFNKLFKIEYGCSPKLFKSSSASTPTEMI